MDERDGMADVGMPPAPGGGRAARTAAIPPGAAPAPQTSRFREFSAGNAVSGGLPLR